MAQVSLHFLPESHWCLQLVVGRELLLVLADLVTVNPEVEAVAAVEAELESEVEVEVEFEASVSFLQAAASEQTQLFQVWGECL